MKQILRVDIINLSALESELLIRLLTFYNPNSILDIEYAQENIKWIADNQTMLIGTNSRFYDNFVNAIPELIRMHFEPYLLDFLQPLVLKIKVTNYLVNK